MSTDPVELPKRVPKGVRQLIRQMEAEDWTFRSSTNQHLIGRHPDGSTMSISPGRGNRLAASNAARLYRQWLNQKGTTA